MSAPALFCFTDEHRALREVLREFFTGPADWSRLLGEVGADEILTGNAGTAIDLAILAEEAGAALFDGPVLSTAALGALAAGVDGVSSGAVTVAATGSLLGFGGSPEIWDACAGARVVTDTVLDGEPAVVALEATPGLMVSDGLDLTRRFGRLPAADLEALPAMVLSTGADAAAAVHAAHQRADLMVSAELLGVAQHCLDGTVEYARQRVQFGRTIGSFQAVKHRLADLLSAVELTRSAVYGAAWGLDGPDAETDLAVAAALSRQTAAEVTRAAIQLHGGIAITWEHWAHRYLRRAHAVLAMAGSAAHHRDRLASAMSGGAHDR